MRLNKRLLLAMMINTYRPGMNSTGKHSAIVIRPCQGIDELEACFEIQKQVWGFSDRDGVPSQIFVVAQKTGGQVIAAFDGPRQIGFVLAFMAADDRGIFIHSHFAGVLPEYQGHGIGRRLKLAQRDDCLQRGISRMQWTFDPLAFVNAHFNINQLGCIVRHYVRNQYGLTSSHLHGGLETDRFVAEWELRSPRVLHILEGGLPSLPSGRATITLPANTTALARNGSRDAAEIQARIRQEFADFFARGYAVTAFDLGAEQARYLLEPYAEL